MTTATLLFELGTEELPAEPLKAMALALQDGLTLALENRGLTYQTVRWYATPRRLAVLARGVSRQAPDQTQRLLGPPIAAAKTADGEWTPAALGFARKQGLTPESLTEIDSDKGPRLGVELTVAGASLDSEAGAIITEAVSNIPIAKRMRWGRGRDEFLRPIQWLVAMIDTQVVPLTLFGFDAGRHTRGHRFHHPEPIELMSADDYESALHAGYVIADFDTRQQRITDQVEQLAAEENLTAVVDDGLLDEVCGLVEWPQAIKGSFDPAFLDVPAEALISSMREHQKYFHLVNDKGDLQPLFITVANIESEHPEIVAAGNEKVIRPRLADAAFFFNNDKMTPLAKRQEKLEGVVFQHQLGTLADKTQRITLLATSLATTLNADTNHTARAAQLAKCDLVSELVLEFPELQGIAGAHYARHDGEPEAVVTAVEQYYWPRYAGDALPTTAEATAVALADRLDTVVGIFGIGQIPTGSKDPFGLRRASLGIIRMLIAAGVDLDLDRVIQQSIDLYPADCFATSPTESVRSYIIDRLRAWYEDQGIRVDVLRSVLASDLSSLAEIDRRVHAVEQFASTTAAADLASANKRVANILAKSTQESWPAAQDTYFKQREEHNLFNAIDQCERLLSPLLQAREYSAALNHLADLQGPVDAFFDAVMVNDDDPDIRANRYALLAMLRTQFTRIADIAFLAPASHS